MLHGIVTAVNEPVNLQKCIVFVYSYRWYCELVLYRLSLRYPPFHADLYR